MKVAATRDKIFEDSRTFLKDVDFKSLDKYSYLFEDCESASLKVDYTTVQPKASIKISHASPTIIIARDPKDVAVARQKHQEIDNDNLTLVEKENLKKMVNEEVKRYKHVSEKNFPTTETCNKND